MADQNTIVTKIPDELTMQIAALLRNGLGVQSTTANSENLSLGFKLEGDNYAMWATLMKKAVGGRGRSSHITGEPLPPSKSDATFARWEQDDQCVFTWLIQNIDAGLVNNVSQYPTAKALWDGLAVTYGSETDSLQVFDLHKKANSLRQGGDTLEDCWNKLQKIWMTIDRRDPNPMKHAEDIQIYNNKIQEQRLFQLLMAIDDKLEPIKRDILKKDPLPSVEAAYATIRREVARLNILKPITTETDRPSEIGLGLVGKESTGRPKPRSGPLRGKDKEDKSKLYCTHCKQNRHTKETCFKIVGYPEWWEKPGQQGKAAAVVGSRDGGGESHKSASQEQEEDQLGFGGVATEIDKKGGAGHSYEGDNWAWY